MRVLFTGATGVIGREAIPQLLAAGHDVVGVSRSAAGRAWLDGIGATGVQVDLFDPASVGPAVSEVDAVAHFATAIPPRAQMPKLDAWHMNDRLRTEATAILVDAAIAHGTQRFVQESITFIYADGGEEWIDEESAVEPAWESLHSALDAEGEVARFVEHGGTGVTLRMSSLYGPGRVSSEQIAAVAERNAPIVGPGENFVSHLHIEDAGSSVAAAMSAPTGTYNVSDDEPVTSRQDLEALARALGVRPPRRIPAPVARVAAGRATGLLTTSQRVSNQKFKTATGWSPLYRSVLEGWEPVVAAWRSAGASNA
ncbi:MAG TPA: NAD(P)-dependent oxidoreductase [Acidimicrobiia bacterium]|nr:NAD(P)-dependent oxidoreductase [Acidimicrobiia bacterium]